MPARTGAPTNRFFEEKNGLDRAFRDTETIVRALDPALAIMLLIAGLIGTTGATAVRVVLQTAPYDHCNFTVLETAPPTVARFKQLLLGMSYDDPALRPLLDLEGLKQWLPGRTSGYAALDRAVP